MSVSQPGFWAGERVMGVNQSLSGLRRDDRTSWSLDSGASERVMSENQRS